MLLCKMPGSFTGVNIIAVLLFAQLMYDDKGRGYMEAEGKA